MPLASNILADYERLTSSAAALDVSGRTLISVAGRERMVFLHNFCTADIKGLPAGQGREAFITTHQGKTLGRVFIFNLGDALLMDSVPGQAQTLIAHLERFVISEDVTFADETERYGEVLVAGPASGGVIARLFQQDVPKSEPACVPAHLGSENVLIKRRPYATAWCYFLHAPRTAILPLTAALAVEGAELCAAEAIEIARVEAGFPLFGRDITPDNLPQEIGRDREAISFTKGCYLGQETVARIDALGHVNRKLVGVRFSGIEVPADGTVLNAGDKEVGRVTSAVWSPKLNSPLALALVRTTQSLPRTQLSSDVGAAEVIALPA